MFKKFFKSSMLLAMAAFSSSLFAQNVLYVNPSATGNNDGTSWANAYTSLQSAIENADTALTVDSILVAGGTYIPSTHLPNYTSDRSKSFLIKRSNIALVGGYDASTGLRDIAANPSVINGEIGDTALVTDNTHILMYVNGSANDTLQNVTIDGFTFLNAYNNFAKYTVGGMTQELSSSGGAIFSNRAHLNVKNCHFENNKTNYAGGAISAQRSLLNIINSKFINNESDYGGAVYMLNILGANNIENCYFDGNVGFSTTNAIFIMQGNDYINTIKKSEFTNSNNSCIITCSLTSCNLVDNKIHNNTNTNTLNTGLLYIFSNTNSMSFISGNEIYNNSTVGNFINIIGANALFNNNLIAKNIAGYSLIFANSTIANFSNNTIADNEVYNIFNMYTLNSKNDIIYNNSVTGTNSFTSFTANNSYIQGDTNTANNNFNATLVTPMFNVVDTAYNKLNYSLQFCSPLVNAGDTTGIDSAYLVTDLLGNPRIIGSAIDLGAIEKQSDVTAGNYHVNGVVGTQAANNIALIPTCDDGDWTYYTTAEDVDSVLIGIKWNTADSVAKTHAKVYVTTDSAYAMVSNATNDTAMATLGRSWFVDLDTFAVSDSVQVRFYYAAVDTTAINNAFAAANMSALSSAWFMTPTAYNAASMLTYNNINNGDYETFTAANGTTGAYNYVELSGVSGLVGGSYYVLGAKEPTSIGKVAKATFSVVPNPATHVITLSNLSASLLNTTAVVVDMYGRVMDKVTITPTTTIDVANYAAGIYSVQVQGGGAVKFVKL